MKLQFSNIPFYPNTQHPSPRPGGGGKPTVVSNHEDLEPQSEIGAKKNGKHPHFDSVSRSVS